jgi:hypothetical protein
MHVFYHLFGCLCLSGLDDVQLPCDNAVRHPTVIAAAESCYFTDVRVSWIFSSNKLFLEEIKVLLKTINTAFTKFTQLI